MSNIEIHGHDLAVAKMMREQIFGEMFKGKPCVKDMIVTVVPSIVTNKAIFGQSFIRLFCPSPGEAEEIMDILRQYLPGEDIEYVRIEKFVPRTKPQGRFKR